MHTILLLNRRNTTSGMHASSSMWIIILLLLLLFQKYISGNWQHYGFTLPLVSVLHYLHKFPQYYR